MNTNTNTVTRATQRRESAIKMLELVRRGQPVSIWQNMTTEELGVPSARTKGAVAIGVYRHVPKRIRQKLNGNNVWSPCLGKLQIHLNNRKGEVGNTILREAIEAYIAEQDIYAQRIKGRAV